MADPVYIMEALRDAPERATLRGRILKENSEFLLTE
jgi:hypothetical protein